MSDPSGRASALRRLAGIARLRRQFAIYILARLGSGMTLLALLLTAHDVLHSYARAGIVNAVYGIGVAIGVPVFGRLADRRGERFALPAAAAVNGCGIATVLLSGHLPTMLIGALLAGLGLPPTGPCLRASWREMPPEERMALFALDGVVLEAAQLVGPVLVGFLAIPAPRVALLVAGVTIVVSALLASRTFRIRTSRGECREHWLGPLRVVEIDLLLVVLGLVTGAIALVEVAVVAFGTSRGSSAESGLLLGAMSAGSIVGGLVVGARARPATWAQLAWRTAAAVAGFAILPLAGASFAAQLALLAVSSVVCAPLFATIFSLLGEAAPSRHVTETYAWVGTANYLAIAIGTAVGGALLAHVHRTGNYLIAVAVLALAAAVALVAYRRTRSPSPSPLPEFVVSGTASPGGGEPMTRKEVFKEVV